MKKVLFVCTGNTCRSPMAEAIFNSQAKLHSRFEAFSRGLFADGSEMSENAKSVLLDDGIVFSHTSRMLTQKDVDSADMIFGITGRHGQAIIDKFPCAHDKVYLMPFDIPDPYGGSIQVYKDCYENLKKAIEIITKIIGDTHE